MPKKIMHTIDDDTRWSAIHEINGNVIKWTDEEKKKVHNTKKDTIAAK